jgi:hypothetical protein
MQFDRLIRFARKASSRLLYAIPLFSERDPRRRSSTFKQACENVNEFPQSTSAAVDWYLAIRPPETIERPHPTTLSMEEARLFLEHTIRLNQPQIYNFPELFLASLSDVGIYSRDLIIINKEGRILTDSVPSSNQLEKSGIFHRFGLGRASRAAGSYFLLSNAWSGGYYHWLLEALPRLSILAEFPQLQSVNILVHEGLKPFQIQSLEALGIKPSRLVPFDSSYWTLDRLYFTESSGPSGNPSPHAVSWLRNAFSKNRPRERGRRRIYVSRADASGRRVLNEQEIISHLSDFGFEVVCPGALTFEQQIATFNDVDIVIGPHGAAFSNMVFAPASATLIELFGKDYINGCYWSLTNLCKQRHSFLVGASDGRDFVIEVVRLRQLLSSYV